MKTSADARRSALSELEEASRPLYSSPAVADDLTGPDVAVHRRFWGICSPVLRVGNTLVELDRAQALAAAAALALAFDIGPREVGAAIERIREEDKR